MKNLVRIYWNLDGNYGNLVKNYGNLVENDEIFGKKLWEFDKTVI